MEKNENLGFVFPFFEKRWKVQKKFNFIKKTMSADYEKRKSRKRKSSSSNMMIHQQRKKKIKLIECIKRVSLPTVFQNKIRNWLQNQMIDYRSKKQKMISSSSWNFFLHKWNKYSQKYENICFKNPFMFLFIEKDFIIDMAHFATGISPLESTDMDYKDSILNFILVMTKIINLDNKYKCKKELLYVLFRYVKTSIWQDVFRFCCWNHEISN